MLVSSMLALAPARLGGADPVRAASFSSSVRAVACRGLKLRRELTIRVAGCATAHCSDAVACWVPGRGLLVGRYDSSADLLGAGAAAATLPAGAHETAVSMSWGPRRATDDAVAPLAVCASSRGRGSAGVEARREVRVHFVRLGGECVRATSLLEEAEGQMTGALAWGQDAGAWRLCWGGAARTQGGLLSWLPSGGNVLLRMPATPSDAFALAFWDHHVVLTGCRSGQLFGTDTRQRLRASMLASALASAGSIAWLRPLSAPHQLLVARTSLFGASCDEPLLSRLDLRTGRTLLAYPGHVATHRADCEPALDPDGLLLAALGADGVLRAWDVHTAQPLASLALPGERPQRAKAVLRLGTSAATARGDGSGSASGGSGRGSGIVRIWAEASHADSLDVYELTPTSSL